MDSHGVGRTAIPAAAYQVLGVFRCAMLTYDHVSAARITAGGLTAQQYALLVMIAGRGEQAPSIGEAAQELLLSHNSAVELSQRAERSGLLSRQTDPDQGRRTLLKLTDEGARRLDLITRRLVTELGQERLEMQASLIRWRTLLASGRFETVLQGGEYTPQPTPVFTLDRAEQPDRPLVWNLLQLHLQGLSAYHGAGVDANGEYRYPSFEPYWQGGQNQPYLVKVGTRPAGFLLLKCSPSGRYGLQELFLLHPFQGRGLGRSVISKLFKDRPGRWSVGYHTENLAAHHFWRRVLEDLRVVPGREQAARLPVGQGWRVSFTVPHLD